MGDGGESVTSVPTPDSLHRYNGHLPDAYRPQIAFEQQLMLQALRTLTASIAAGGTPDDSSDSDSSHLVSESYDLSLERDLAALEKGLQRYFNLKYKLTPADYTSMFSLLLRAVLSPDLDMGLRSRLARVASGLLSKGDCEIEGGFRWRPLMDKIVQTHIRNVDGGLFVGREVREPHCRNLTTLLGKARYYLPDDDSSERIWEEFGEKIDPTEVDSAFETLLLMNYVLPTRGDAWTGWVCKGMELWRAVESSSHWDTVWMGLMSRVARHQPLICDWTPFLPHIYSRLANSFRLPLGSAAPHSPIERVCPRYCHFLLPGDFIPAAAVFVIYSISPLRPASREYLGRLLALLANYCHPSNSGHWSSYIGSFLVHCTANLAVRVIEERAATKAGEMNRVLSNNNTEGIAPFEHRLTESCIDDLVDELLPLIKFGLQSKSTSMSLHAASASRDLAVVVPRRIVTPLLEIAEEGLTSISSPHRTAAALKLLASLTPVFLDPQLFPTGLESLPHALQLALPGIDANDPGKTTSTLRFIAGAAARLQSLVGGNENHNLAPFLEEYLHEFLERIFTLLSALEAPAKKNRSGGSSSPQLAYWIFAIAVENLFCAVPGRIAISAANRVSRQVSNSAHMNALKHYGALVRFSAAAAATASSSGSSANLFLPTLLDQVLDDSSAPVCFTALSEEELVWRIRMMAQTCRTCGPGIVDYMDRISTVISLGIDRPERAVYKAAGRLLRGVLEGLTAIRLNSYSDHSKLEENIDFSAGEMYRFEWKSPSNTDWKTAADLAGKFLSLAESMTYTPGPSAASVDVQSESKRPASTSKVIVNRDVLFRVLRLLHAVQRGSRWLLAGVVPEHFRGLDRFRGTDGFSSSETSPMTKAEALLALKRPIAAGLGGERDGEISSEFATVFWERIYTLVSRILASVLDERPDDGALLYRCLEPIEMANEPFRHSSYGRHTIHASRAYKGAYKPVVATKRPFNAVGGVGRAMPKFIFKLRVEAQHEVRLGLAAAPGLNCPDIFNTVLRQLSVVSVNDFPRVRAEARGALTRALRYARPAVRREEIERLIGVMSASASAASRNSLSEGLTENEGQHDGGESQANMTLSNNIDAEMTDVARGQSASPASRKSKDVAYEKIIGAASVLRSTATGPFMMRNWNLFQKISRVVLETLLVAERPDAFNMVASLYARLASMARPLAIEPAQLIGEDLSLVPSANSTRADSIRPKRHRIYENMNEYLLRMLRKTSGASNTGGKTSQRNNEAHWRIQSLVATTLYMTLREDRPPPVDVVRMFAKGMVSDVVSLRQISVKAMSLLLALHGRKPDPEVHNMRNGFAPEPWSAPSSEAMVMLDELLGSEEYAQKLIHTLALDHEDVYGESGDGNRRGSISSSGGGVLTAVSLASYVDGDSCWMLHGGRPWPTSWIPRSRDSLNLARIRLFEGIFRVFGRKAFQAFSSPVQELVDKVKSKSEKIISGVKDDDVRVIVAEVIAGACRGVLLSSLKEVDEPVSIATKWVTSILDSLSGPHGTINGGTLIRFVATASSTTLGSRVAENVFNWVLNPKPIIAVKENGSVAQLQARRLRYIHSCGADFRQSDSLSVRRIQLEIVDELISVAGFAHELKAVREEVARCLSLLASLNHDQSAFSESVDKLIKVLETGTKGLQSRLSSNANDEADFHDSLDDKLKKQRSRHGETLSRFVSFVYWSGQTKRFRSYFTKFLPSLFLSLDENDPERLYHTRIALSLAAQGRYDENTLSTVIETCRDASKETSWKVRGGVLPFVQVLSFMSLFSASQEQLTRLRDIVIDLLFDPQIEVRQAAAATFVPLIRDAPPEAISKARETFLSVMARTQPPRRRGGRRPSMTSEQILQRHGAALGLSSMVISSPYSVPKWMPSVLVALSPCVNDPPPISASGRSIFADFFRTHRDEWQMHKTAFTEEELEIVQEILVSPSYYA